MDRRQAQELVHDFEEARGALSANYHLHLATHGPECDIIACADNPGFNLGSQYAVQWQEGIDILQRREEILVDALVDIDAVSSDTIRAYRAARAGQ